MLSFYWLAICTLASWRLTHLLSVEDGPWDLMVRLRRTAGTGFGASLLDCFLCTGVWVSAPLALIAGGTWTERLILWPAISGGAALLQRAFETSDQPGLPVYYEDHEAQPDDHENVRGARQEVREKHREHPDHRAREDRDAHPDVEARQARNTEQAHRHAMLR